MDNRTEFDLQRFVDAQAGSYESALAEVKAGRKRSHWMWYVFPQMKGLGHSETSEFYGIENLAEAKAYVAHPILGERLREVCKVLLELPTNDAKSIFGFPDDMKLKSSMTLFAMAADKPEIFNQVLGKYFGGEPNQNTANFHI